jgi:hypothetical protein
MTTSSEPSAEATSFFLKLRWWCSKYTRYKSKSRIHAFAHNQ